MALTEKMWKAVAKVSGLNQYMDNDLLTNTQGTTVPPCIIYHNLFTARVSLKPIQLQLLISSPPTKPTKAESLLLWCNSAWQSPEITFSPSQLPYATGRAEDRHRSPSWGQDIVACKKEQAVKKIKPSTTHVGYTLWCQPEIISSYSFPKTKLLSWVQVPSVLTSQFNLAGI